VSIRQNIESVLEKIAVYCRKAGVPEGSVDLVAVSKTVTADKIKEAYDAGLRMFGENRVSEFVQKSGNLPEEIKWNLIGQLQTNKVKYIIDKSIYLLHSLDRVSLAKKLQTQCEKRDTEVNALIQLKLTREETKSGVDEDKMDDFLEELEAFDRIKVKGIMTMGPAFGEEKEIRDVFAKARNIFDKISSRLTGMEHLSMGMSQDYGWAILEGSNMVRIGTAVFGDRHYVA